MRRVRPSCVIGTSSGQRSRRGQTGTTPAGRVERPPALLLSLWRSPTVSLSSTVSLVAVLNTDVDAFSDENHLLRTRVTELQERIIEMESQAGLPTPRSSERHVESPPHKRARYGTAAARTTVEAP
ncbi:unnamed protein product [Urochloa humidicola]